MRVQETADAANQFRKRHAKVWKAFNELVERCHEAGPLDEKSRRLVKLAMSIDTGLEGATHSALRSAGNAGVTADEIDHVAVLSIRTLGLPVATRTMTWISDDFRKAR